MWNGYRDARSVLPDSQEPNPYWEYLSRKGHERASRIERLFWQEDQKNKRRWIQAVNRQHQAEVELGWLEQESEKAQSAYQAERDRDRADARELNPPGRAYIHVAVYWVLLGLLIVGDAAISYSAFLSIGKVSQWQVVALSIMVVVSMVVVGHVIGDRFRHGQVSNKSKAVMFLVVVLISIVMTLFREDAQETARQATSASQLDQIILTAPAPDSQAPQTQSGGSGSDTSAAPATAVQTPESPSAQASGESGWSFSLDFTMVVGFFMFLIITSMGIVIPAVLAYYVERRPRLLKVAEEYQRWQWARTRLYLGRKRLFLANRELARSPADRAARHVQAVARLNESREAIYYLMSLYANVNMRMRKRQGLAESLRDKPTVPGGEILGDLDWTNPDPRSGTTPAGTIPKSTPGVDAT